MENQINYDQIVDFMLESGVIAEQFVQAVNNVKVFDMLLERVKRSNKESRNYNWRMQEEREQLKVREENVKEREKSLNTLQADYAESLNERSRLIKEVAKLKREIE